MAKEVWAFLRGERIFRQRRGIVRSAALRSSALSLLKSCSIELCSQLATTALGSNVVRVWEPRHRATSIALSGAQRSFSPTMERKDPFGVSATLKVSVTLKISAGGG